MLLSIVHRNANPGSVTGNSLETVFYLSICFGRNKLIVSIFINRRLV